MVRGGRAVQLQLDTYTARAAAAETQVAVKQRSLQSAELRMPELLSEAETSSEMIQDHHNLNLATGLRRVCVRLRASPIAHCLHTSN